MAAPRLTKKFPAHIKPVHAGVYKVKSVAFDNAYAFWHGTYWSPACSSIEAAYRVRYATALKQNKQWQGLAVKP